MNGVIIINKPSGLTSSDACLKVKRTLGLKKVGHLGTLDPLATGVLPLCLNEGTKLVQFLLKSDKEYAGTMKLGVETDTWDSQGKIIGVSSSLPADPELIQRVFQDFRGESLQTPPMFSALKHKGVPLYKIARKGGWVHRKQRKIFIGDIEVLDIDLPHVVFRVACSHGTYIRALCHDIGTRLSCGAHLTGLKRIRNGAFHINNAISLDDFENCSREELTQKYLIPSKDALQGIPEVVVNNEMEEKIRRGIQPTVADIADFNTPKMTAGQQIKIISAQGSLVGIVASLVNGDIKTSGNEYMKAWKILRVFSH